MRADERRDDVPAIDVAYQHDGQIHFMREAHVGDVVRAQVRLGRTAGAFDDDPVALALQPPIGLDCETQQVPLVAAMILRIRARRRADPAR